MSNPAHRSSGSEVISVYTAGPMPERREIRSGHRLARWRRELVEALEGIWEHDPLPEGVSVRFDHPEGIGCDHGGVNVRETLRRDMEMLQRADVVAGYLPRGECYGALAEIGWAAGIGDIHVTVAEVFGLGAKLSPLGEWEPSDPFEVAADDERSISGHLCPCGVIDGPKGAVGRYWFLRGIVEKCGGRALYLEHENFGAVAEMVNLAVRASAANRLLPQSIRADLEE